MPDPIRCGAPAQHGLIQNGGVLHWKVSRQDALPLQPPSNGILDIEVPHGIAVGEARPDVLRGLEQAGHEYQAVLGDPHRAGLQLGVTGLTLGHIGVCPPPAALVGLPSQGDEPLLLLGVGAESFEEIHDVGQVWADFGVLQARELGVAPAQPGGELLQLVTLGFPQLAQLLAEALAPEHRGVTDWHGEQRSG